MDAIQSFTKTIQSHQLFGKGDRLLIAISGGSDSTALCHICYELGYEIGLAHVNYRLRGKDAEGDAEFVEDKAAELGISAHIKTTDCKQYAKEQQLSIQEAARNIRYDFFESIILMHQYDYVLTAHHARDNIETMLYTLSKGATIKGLRGIPLSRENIRRPLLHTTKKAIDLYLKRNQIAYRNDISNDDSKYQRNYIRKEILPKLERINPNLEGTLSNTSILGAGYQHLLDSALADQKMLFLESKKLRLDSKVNDPSRFAWLYELIKPLGFNFNQSLVIWDTLSNVHSTGKTFSSTNHLLTIDRGSIVLSEINDTVESPSLTIESIESSLEDSNGKLELKHIEILPTDRGAYFNASKIIFPLTLRNWQPGDRFKPSGMKGKSKKVKDYLTDQKISGPAKGEVQVLLSQEKIVWVVGHRLADGYVANPGDSIVSIEVNTN